MGAFSSKTNCVTEWVNVFPKKPRARRAGQKVLSRPDTVLLKRPSAGLGNPAVARPPRFVPHHPQAARPAMAVTTATHVTNSAGICWGSRVQLSEEVPNSEICNRQSCGGGSWVGH